MALRPDIQSHIDTILSPSAGAGRGQLMLGNRGLGGTVAIPALETRGSPNRIDAPLGSPLPSINASFVLTPKIRVARVLASR
ncbi:hypothetical protein DHEL01_v208867 [Diaporthe helianthi]|uniref:Uncharacterized protein n=1 Tax=Diaporthe helianthi TaxID=158607 RepID=A0A2P5HRB7_DIAHE|nr:hypothetical protein DHEL01_v208867 [Diaporthe helianthi]